MLKRILILIFSFLFYISSAASNDLKIVYVDIDKIINLSKAGKQVTKKLEDLNKNNIKKYKKIEKELTDEEKNLIKKKNILSKEEYEKKIITLQKNIKIFKKDINNSRKDLDKKRIEATTKILDILNPILAEYSSKNSISLMIQKKNIVMGKSELEITDQILELLNAKVKTIK